MRLSGFCVFYTILNSNSTTSDEMNRKFGVLYIILNGCRVLLLDHLKSQRLAGADVVNGFVKLLKRTLYYYIHIYG